ncbi:CRPV-253 [Crowpox virus]|nr:CRPV-253 [Crowpox virus]
MNSLLKDLYNTHVIIILLLLNCLNPLLTSSLTGYLSSSLTK